MVCYGSKICPYCRNFLRLNEARRLGITFIEITDNTIAMKEFLKYRDSLDLFKDVRSHSGIGIPFFVDGDRVTLDKNEALAWIGQPPMTDEEFVERPKK